MSPTESQPTMPAIMVNGQALPSPPERVQAVQPRVAEPMNPERPHAEDEDSKLRGGDRGGMCPGRFCFIIPCPIPCDFCII
ncbi:hypothetical protein N0V82_007148 [Gnomoniopsis sp. IMI 355080]|nr:hypothetical protein N0V82_007148 [Gnomoniopsis sp. IMI 355080]